jgi:hypothetical protein
MHRWLLAVTALVLGIGFMAVRASESAALQQKMETHSLPSAAAPAELPLSTPSSGIGTDNGDISGASFDSQIEAWIGSLSARDEFRSWLGAKWSRYPLGPGMHGWLILLHKEGKEIGYLVVGSTEDGKLKLTEYGAGDSPLFSLNTLYRTLVQLELIRTDTDPIVYLQSSPVPPDRLYFSPLHAVWKVKRESEWIYIDAKTGELLPLSDQSFLSLQPYDPAAALPNPLPRMARSLLLSSFDPFDNTFWIDGKPLSLTSASELLASVGPERQSVTFTANLYGKTVLVPLAVTGYHDWGGNLPYVRLEHEGERYVPFDVLAQYGSFYQRRAGGST